MIALDESISWKRLTSSTSARRSQHQTLMPVQGAVTKRIPLDNKSIVCAESYCDTIQHQVRVVITARPRLLGHPNCIPYTENSMMYKYGRGRYFHRGLGHTVLGIACKISV